MTKPIETLSSQIAFSCPWYNVRQDGIRLPDGSIGQFNVVESPPCVFIVPITTNNEIVLIHQYRYTLDTWCWEVPAGAIHENQTPLAAAQQELREEVGGVSTDWLNLGDFFLGNGRSNEVAHLFVALNVELGAVAHESGEIITIHPTSISQTFDLIQNNHIKDAPSVLAILLAQSHFP